MLCSVYLAFLVCKNVTCRDRAVHSFLQHIGAVSVLLIINNGTILKDSSSTLLGGKSVFPMHAVEGPEC